MQLFAEKVRTNVEEGMKKPSFAEESGKVGEYRVAQRQRGRCTVQQKRWEREKNVSERRLAVPGPLI